jgi:hypothetical protein
MIIWLSTDDYFLPRYHHVESHLVHGYSELMTKQDKLLLLVSQIHGDPEEIN